MADDQGHEPDERQPSLELPSLRSALRRRRVGAKMVKPDAESSYDDSAKSVRVEERVAEPRERRATRLRVPGVVAAAVTGVLVGLAMVGLTAASLHACTSLRGTSSCGTPGVLLLLAIAVVAIVLGSLLLRLAGVDTHGSTSFLGIGLLTVLILLALLPVLDRWWAVVAVPGLAMVTYAASWWLTTTNR